MILNKPPEAISNLNHALQQSDARLAQNPKALDLRATALTDPSFVSLSNQPDFQKIIHPAR